MLDGWARRLIDPSLDRAAQADRRGRRPRQRRDVRRLRRRPRSPLRRSPLQWYLAGLVLMLLSRIGDGLDGAVARIAGKTDLGGYLDIVLDFLFYGVSAGRLRAGRSARPTPSPARSCCFPSTSTARASSPMRPSPRSASWRAQRAGQKSLFFTTGLAEATETIAVFAAFCLVPQWFPEIAYAFAALTFYTALSRIVLAARTFRMAIANESLGRVLIDRARFTIHCSHHYRRSHSRYFPSAISISTNRSSASSSPTDSRTVPGPMPSSVRASSLRFLWVVVAGWVIRLLRRRDCWRSGSARARSRRRLPPAAALEIEEAPGRAAAHLAGDDISLRVVVAARIDHAADLRLLRQEVGHLARRSPSAGGRASGSVSRPLSRIQALKGDRFGPVWRK